MVGVLLRLAQSFGRRVEGDLGRVDGLAFDQGPQRVIDLRYHLLIVP